MVCELARACVTLSSFWSQQGNCLKNKTSSRFPIIPAQKSHDWSGHFVRGLVASTCALRAMADRSLGTATSGPKSHDLGYICIVAEVVKLWPHAATKRRSCHIFETVSTLAHYQTHYPSNSSACALAEADLRSPSMRASSSRRASRLSSSGAMVTAVEFSS